MSKATENKLGALHGKLADVLTEIIGMQEEKVDYDAEGNEIPTGEMTYTAPPAYFAVATKFLKDNDITCDAETNENMNNLRDVLSKKQKHSRLGDATQAAKH